MSACVFCEEILHKENEIARTDLFKARWDFFPVTPGHAEIIPLRHVQYIDELTQQELAEMMVFSKDVIEKVRTTNFENLYNNLKLTAPAEAQLFIDTAINRSEATHHQPDALNIGINDGPDAGQSIPHLHMHILPRWKDDVSHPRGGVRNIFPNDRYSETL